MPLKFYGVLALLIYLVHSVDTACSDCSTSASKYSLDDPTFLKSVQDAVSQMMKSSPGGSLSTLTDTTPLNYIRNGEFQDPIIPIGQNTPFIREDIIGWNSDSIEIGIGNIYNPNWRNTQVAQIDSTNSVKLSQSFSTLQAGFKYILSFDWAAKSGYETKSSATIKWNGKLIKKITGSDTVLHHEQINVIAKNMVNTLQITGIQGTSGNGLTFDNFFLIQSPQNLKRSQSTMLLKNYVVNGDFSQPLLTNALGFEFVPNGIVGWKSKTIGRGRGNLYNTRHGGYNVLELDSGSANERVSQLVDGLVEDRKYRLKFNWAARDAPPNLDINSMQGNVYWNSQLLLQIKPTNFQIYTTTIDVVAGAGINLLEFDGSSAVDRAGLTISDVSLRQIVENNRIKSTLITPNPNIPIDIREHIINGNFASPQTQHHVLSPGGILGWQGRNVETGVGLVYNPGWASTMVAQLDSDGNDKYVQRISTLHEGSTYLLTFRWAGRLNYVSSSGGKVYWNGFLLDQLIPIDNNIQTASYSVTAGRGINVLAFESTMSSDGLGLTIANISLKEKP